MPWLTALLGGESVKALARPALYALAAFLLFLGLWQITSWDAARFEAVRADAAREQKTAITARDSHWHAEIEAANRKVLEASLEEQKASAARSAEAEAQISALRQTITEYEAANAALPNAARVGLSRARVRLLRDRTAGTAPAASDVAPTPPVRPFGLEGAVPEASEPP